LGIILNVLGLVLKQDRRAATLGLVISGALVALFLATALC